IAQLSGDFARIARRHEDLLSHEAIRDYFGEVYWRKGEALDAHKVVEAFKADRMGTDFAYRRVGTEFRLIESGMEPVIVAREFTPRKALAELSGPRTHTGRIARKLQPFTVQVPPKARALLLANGHVRFERDDRFGTQFAVLMNDDLYRNDIGLLWENAEYLQVEGSII